MKKRFVCVVLLVCLIVLSSVFFTGCSQESVVPPPENSPVSIQSKGQGITSVVELTDLSYRQMGQLYSFYHYTEPGEFRYNDIFRDASLGINFWWLASRNAGAGEGVPDDGQDSRLRSRTSEGFEFLYRKEETLNQQEKSDVVFFDGRKKFSLSDDEIVVSKYAYLTLYVDQFGLEIDEETTYRIIDDEDVFAKYVILRNCHMFGYFTDGLAIEYYGLDRQTENKPLFVEVKYMVNDIAYAKTKKVVGYYEMDCSAFAARKTDINNMFSVNMDAYRNPDFYREIFERTDTGTLYNLLTALCEPKLKEDGTVVFIEPFTALNYQADPDIFAMRNPDLAAIQEGRDQSVLSKTVYIYGN